MCNDQCVFGLVSFKKLRPLCNDQRVFGLKRKKKKQRHTTSAMRYCWHFSKFGAQVSLSAFVLADKYFFVNPQTPA